MSGLSGQTKRDILSLGITLLIYILFFAVWLHFYRVLTPSLAQPNMHQIALSLDDFSKEVQADISPEEKSAEQTEAYEPPVQEESMVPEEPPVPEDIVEEDQAPPDTPEPQEEPLPKEPEPPLETPPPEPLSEQPKATTIKKPKPKKPVVRKHTRKKISKRSSRAPAKRRKKGAAHHSTNVSGRSNSAQRSGSVGSNRFIARLKAKINAHKRYPHIARKRKMEGSVRVRFRISAAGKLTGLTASGPRVFLSSAKQAVRSAFPISTRGASLPLSVSLTLNYRLRK